MFILTDDLFSELFEDYYVAGGTLILTRDEMKMSYDLKLGEALTSKPVKRRSPKKAAKKSPRKTAAKKTPRKSPAKKTTKKAAPRKSPTTAKKRTTKSRVRIRN